jgi:hypothetical protein
MPKRLVTLDSFVHYSSLGALAISLIGLLFAVRSYRQQVRVQILFQISDRYHNLLNSSPMLILEMRKESPQTEESSPEFRASILRYLFIVHFSHVLLELGYLDRDLWKILHAEHRRTLTRPGVLREWHMLKGEFDTFPNFIRYVDCMNVGAEKSHRFPFKAERYPDRH